MHMLFTPQSIFLLHCVSGIIVVAYLLVMFCIVHDSMQLILLVVERGYFVVRVLVLKRSCCSTAGAVRAKVPTV